MFKVILLLAGILTGSIIIDGVIAIVSVKLEEQMIRNMKIIKKVMLLGASIAVGMM